MQIFFNNLSTNFVCVGIFISFCTTEYYLYYLFWWYKLLLKCLFTKEQFAIVLRADFA